MLPDWFVTDCRREFDRDPGSTETFLRLLNLAAEFGRESAYTTDEIEWGMRRADDGRVLKAWDEDDARTSVAHNPQLSLRRRRVGPWEKVSDA